MFTLHIPMPRSVHFVGLAAGLLLTISELLAVSGGIETRQETALTAAAASVQDPAHPAADEAAFEETGRRSGRVNANSLADTPLSLASNY